MALKQGCGVRRGNIFADALEELRANETVRGELWYQLLSPYKFLIKLLLRYQKEIYLGLILPVFCVFHVYNIYIHPETNCPTSAFTYIQTYKLTESTKLWMGIAVGRVRACHSPTCGFHIRGSEYSPVFSCGSAELQFGSCCAGEHHGWTRAVLRLVCASLSSSGNHSLEDLWFDQQEKEVSPKTNKCETKADKESHFACWMQAEHHRAEGQLDLLPLSK